MGFLIFINQFYLLIFYFFSTRRRIAPTPLSLAEYVLLLRNSVSKYLIKQLE